MYVQPTQVRIDTSAAELLPLTFGQTIANTERNARALKYLSSRTAHSNTRARASSEMAWQSAPETSP